MEKLKFRVEFDDADGLTMVRPHRVFYGGSKKDRAGALAAELEFGEDEPVFAIMPGPGDDLKGRSCVVEGAKGLILTADPDLYGTDADREAAGLTPAKRLKWGEWNPLGLP